MTDLSQRSRVIIVSPGGMSGRGGMASVTRTMADWIKTSRPETDVRVLDARGGGSSWMWPLHFCKAVVKTIALGLKGRPRILHLQVSERNSFIRKGLLSDIGHMLGMTVVLHHHGAELIPFYRSTNPLMRWWTRRTVLGADHNLVLGERWETFLREEVGVHAGKVSVLYNASVDLASKVEAARALLPQADGAFRILMLANLSPRKGVGEFLAAVRRLRDEGLAVHATLAGGGEIARYTAEAKALGLADDCTFKGWIDRGDVAGLLAEAHCLALPSFEEGLPMTILEALSCRVPVVATPVGSIGELLTSGMDCLLVRPGDVEDLAGAFCRLAQDAALRISLADNGRKLFERRFSVEVFMRDMLSHYERTLQARTGGTASVRS